MTVTPSFLHLCEEELRPDLLASYERSSTLWRVASIASVVALSALLVGGMIATTLYAPVFIPIAGGTSLLLIDPIKKVYDTFAGYAKTAAERSSQLRTIHQHHASLISTPPAGIQQILRDKGIHQVSGMGWNDPRLNTLKPLLARHLFWEGHVENLRKQTLEIKEVIDEFHQDPSSPINQKPQLGRKIVFSMQRQALELEREHLEAKVKNAFINAVLRRPTYVGTLEDLGSFSELSGIERAAAIPTQTPGAQHLFTFKSGHPPLQYDSVKQLTVSDIAMRMVAAMPA